MATIAIGYWENKNLIIAIIKGVYVITENRILFRISRSKPKSKAIGIE